jgi:hypothetical protein
MPGKQRNVHFPPDAGSAVRTGNVARDGSNSPTAQRREDRGRNTASPHSEVRGVIDNIESIL